MARTGIFCLGNIVVDCLVRPVNRMPEWSTSTVVDSISMHLGGNGAAAAYAAARLGAPVRLAGAVGADLLGNFALSRLSHAGVDTAAVQRLEQARTAATVGLINDLGKRLFLHEPGAGAALGLGDIRLDAENCAECSILHYASLFSLPRLRTDARVLLQQAHRLGLTVSVDTDWDAQNRWFRDFEPLCSLIDYLFLNSEEARMLTASSDPQQICRFFRQRGVKVVILKRGAKGCAVSSGSGYFELAAHSVQAVDTTGAGDCFCGAFLAALSRGFALREAARLANAVGALSATTIGGTDGILDYQATCRWMEESDAAAGGWRKRSPKPRRNARET